MASSQGQKISILGFAVSLRKGSFNKSLLRAAQELLPSDVELEIFDLKGISPFNQDPQNHPSERVKKFKAKIVAADGILIATPEYNYSVPGLLRDTIDAATRPYDNNSFDGKLVAVMGASIGTLGTTQEPNSLRQTMIHLDMYPLNEPEVMVSSADKFDETGCLIDERTRSKVKELIEALVLWIRTLDGWENKP